MGAGSAAWETDCAGPRRERSNQRRVVAWGLAWMGSFAAVIVGLEAGWVPAGAAAVVAALACAVLGIGTVGAYRRSLREADELRRKIELDGLAVAFGVGLVGAGVVQLLENGGVLGGPGVAYVMVVMALTFLVAVWLGHRRYR